MLCDWSILHGCKLCQHCPEECELSWVIFQCYFILSDFLKKIQCLISPGVVVHALNPSILETEAGGALNRRSTWSIKPILRQPDLLSKTLSRNSPPKRRIVNTLFTNIWLLMTNQIPLIDQELSLLLIIHLWMPEWITIKDCSQYRLGISSVCLVFCES